MRIKVLNTFLVGRDRFTKDDIREVSEETGLNAVANGWAEDIAGRVAIGNPKSSSTDLVVEKSALGVGDSNG